MQRRRYLLLFVLLTLASFGCELYASECSEYYCEGKRLLKIATGSPGELGLLRELAEEFCRTHEDVKICWIKAGSGKSLQLLKERRVDLALVHAPEAEKKALQEGWATGRTLIGANEFYLVGPRDDPAGVRNSSGVVDAYRRIAQKGALFLSRGDNSGTHKREMTIWRLTGLNPSGQPWYIVTRDFMMATLKEADRRKGYFMTDSSTWIMARKNLVNLELLYRGDPLLINLYHALFVPAGTTPQADIAAEFVQFISSEPGQKIIREYGGNTFGEPLYRDAEYARRFEKP
ncbi:substrate-binding domain-containing protein [Thermodesulforhabdus norvegica]|uniref:Tungstate transport system substrate-binding protein n=1 Tax=Thermodesulforhabdus norvegica TaxID=39841 RepID=A0A1I4SE67_9BACT|nr:substrate-binding domain-containing protein [Thermodesulforhabdus norvegica]SFM62752.1 tungstate transport system substrate-binding protein [Thermodesulforhabdus norvegica]